MVSLSIIVPVYNVINYLEECIDSLLKIKGVCTQIICVEDASTDGTERLLEEKYGNNASVDIYYNSDNGGLGFSRNVGLQHAVGEYVMFVDSDDYVNSDAVEDIYIKCKNEELDILYFDVVEFTDGKFDEQSDKRIHKGHYKPCTGREIFDKMVQNSEMYGSVWRGIYRREFLYRHNVEFIRGILHEDIPFTFKAILYAKRVDVLKKVGYYYRQRNNSILHKKNYTERAEGLILVYCQLMVIWQSLQHMPEIKNIEKSLKNYTDSIVKMIESNLSKSKSEADEEFSVAKQFLYNFSINTYRCFAPIKCSDWLDNLKNYHSVGFYGAGRKAETYLPFLLVEEVKITGVLVSDKKKNRDTICGFPVVEYSSDLNHVYDAIIIGVGNEISRNIEKYLRNNGFERPVIYIPEL